MPLDQALKDLMITSGTYQNIASRDVYGARTGGTAVSFNCHLTLTRSDRYDANNAPQVGFSGTMVMDDVYDIEKGAIINIADLEARAITVTTYYDEIGENHTTVEIAV